MNWANFDQYVLAIYNAGIDIHAMIGYVPTALQTSSSEQLPPTSNTYFGYWASAIYGRYVWLGTQATGTGRMVDCTFWNEPENEWAGTEAQLVAMYLQCQYQVNYDQNANGNSGAFLSTFDAGAPNTPLVTSSEPYLTSLLSECNSATSPLVAKPTLPSICYHNGPAMFTNVRQSALAIGTLATANGYGGTQLRVTELDMNITQSSFPPNLGAQAGVERNSDTWAATMFYHCFVELMAAGVDMSCIFTMEDIQSYWKGGEYSALFDSGASSSNINGDGNYDGKPTQVLGMLEMMWKHHQGQTSINLRELWSGTASPAPYPNLRGILTTGTNANGKTVVTATYSSFRHVGGYASPKCRVDFEWTMPVGMTVASWKQWGISDNLKAIGRLPVRAQDFSSNAPYSLPIQDLIDWESVHCIQIVGA